jgi:hypothetical protein
MTYSFVGFLDNIIQASVNEANDRLAQTKKRLKQGRAGGRKI